MQGKVRYGDTVFRFANLYRLTIEVGGKAWCYDDKRSKDNQLSFKVVELGYAGMGNWLKQWRKRGRLRKKAGLKKWESLSQAQAAAILGVSQSFISKVEMERKPMPVRMFRMIRKDILKYNRSTIPPGALLRRLPRRGFVVLPQLAQNTSKRG